MKVWITRTQPGADATAGRLRALGHDPVVAPVLDLRPLPVAADEIGAPAALAFTSANAVRAYARLTPERGAVAYGVGAATARAAAKAGFADVRSADGDVRRLARLIAGDPLRPDGPLLHPRGRDAAGDLAGALRRAGITLRSLEIYETVPRQAVAAELADLLATSGLDAVALHSPRAAHTVADLLSRADPDRVERLRAYAISPAALAPIRGLPLRSAAAADRPDEASLLALLPPP